MKKLIILAVVAILGYFGYNQFNAQNIESLIDGDVSVLTDSVSDALSGDVLSGSLEGLGKLGSVLDINYQTGDVEESLDSEEETFIEEVEIILPSKLPTTGSL